MRLGSIISELCEWHGWTVDYVLSAPFTWMMRIYDYGCERHYGRPVPGAGELTKEGIGEMKRRISDALSRHGDTR